MHRNRNVDMKAIAWDAMKKYGFSPEFPPRVKDDVRAMSDSATRTTGPEIRDLRGLLWSSIDNFDSEDLDQLEFCERGVNGEIGVKVAIADVDYYVGKDSPTDRHAAHNGTSVYTGVETFPMLPDKLSKGISSLLPGQDRLAVIIEYTVLPDGNVRHGGVYRALVRNKAKLIYEIIGKWQERTSPVPPSVTGVKGLEEQLRLQGEASRLLRQQRREQGALELNTIEPSPIVEDGKVKDLVVQEQNLARQLIEEFMVAANGTMVAVLGEAGLPMIQRIVRRPKYWEEIVLVAASYHEELPAEPDAKALAQFLLRQQKADPERFPDLSLTIVKLLGPGEYLTLEPGAPPTGHFSLAVIDYTHATAPNRRYVDVVNQRLAKSVIGNTQSPYSAGELDELAAWLTDREKASKKVKRFMAKAVAAVLLQDRTGDIFDALVTGAKETGTFVRLIVPPAEGRVIRGEVGLKVGQKVRVRLLSADPYKGFIDFERVGAIQKSG
jgi:VacB/RNase II family 3'-5' exoribonuclease